VLNHMNTLAAIFRDGSTQLEIQSLAVPSLNAGEILVDVDCCTICGSDLHTIRGDRPVGGPTILGHEVIGRVVELSPDGAASLDHRGTAISVGDRITWSVTACCGECFFCRNDLPQKCDRLLKYGHEVVDGPHPLSGGLSQQCVLVSGTTVIKLPADLPDAVACPANCATATVAAAVRVAGNLENRTVVIHGAGMLGLTAAAMARRAGADRVIVTDLAVERSEVALRFGATQAFAAGDEATIRRAIHDATDHRGADVVFEMSGSVQAVAASLEQLRIGGHLILVGSVFPTRPLEISPEQIVRRMLRIDGVHNYAPDDLARAIEFLSEACAKFPFHELVAAEYSLQDVNQAIKHALTGGAVRIAVRANSR
jgi:putative phosphonate catabolism associated alcohol dehydrogenase